MPTDGVHARLRYGLSQGPSLAGRGHPWCPPYRLALRTQHATSDLPLDLWICRPVDGASGPAHRAWATRRHVAELPTYPQARRSGGVSKTSPDAAENSVEFGRIPAEFPVLPLLPSLRSSSLPRREVVEAG